MGRFHRMKVADFCVRLEGFLVVFHFRAGDSFVEEEVEKKMKFVWRRCDN